MSTAVLNEVPTPAPNGSQTVFTLANPIVAGKTRPYLGGARQKLTTDYSESGSTIVFVTAPASGLNLVVDYVTP